MERKKQLFDFDILLHDIRSVQNVASIFRLGECLGVNTIYLSGITPGPVDRFGRDREDFTKISLGTEKVIKWQRVEKDVVEFILDFKNNLLEKDNFVIALEQSGKSLDYKKVGEEIHNYKNKKYLVVPGREVEGLEEEILKMCDIVAEIPQYGQKESLNIFSSMSVACYRFFDK